MTVERRPWDPEEADRLARLVREGAGVRVLREAFPGRGMDSIHSKAWRMGLSISGAAKAGDPDPAPEPEDLDPEGPQIEGRSVSSDGQTISLRGLRDAVLSPEDLVRVCSIDLEVWAIEHMEYKAYQGFVKGPDKKPRGIQLFSVRVKLKKRNPAVLGLRDTLRAVVAESWATRPPIPVPASTGRPGGVAAVFGAHDLHAGKYAYAPEAGQDYDVEIAERRFTSAVEDLIGKLGPYPVERIFFVLGSDLLNTDNSNDTTAGGTPQTTDGRHQRTMRRVCDMVYRTTKRLLEVAPVEHIVVPGNHDQDSAFAVGEVMRYGFADCPHVKVHNSEQPRKYVQFGRNLMGFAHGHGLTAQALANAMAEEAAAYWGQTWFRFFDVGHLHHQILVEFPGVVVRYNPALCGPEDWHAAKGLIGTRQCMLCQVYDRESGNVAQLSSNPVPPSAASVWVA